MNEQTSDQPPTGELFSRLYVERGAPEQDSLYFRNRLEAYLKNNHDKDYLEICAYLKEEGGLVVLNGDDASSSYLAEHWRSYSDFFSKIPIKDLLNAITIIWRYLFQKYHEPKQMTKYSYTEQGKLEVVERIPFDSLPFHKREYLHPKADAWHNFVSRALREENMAFILDDKCGVHYRVDEEFEINRVSVLKCLEAPRYANVRDAFESAQGYLDKDPLDTKASVRSAFEALEILARLMDPQSNRLNRKMIENKLKPLVIESASDSTEKETSAKLIDGLADTVDGLHYYRHGQGTEEPVAPSLMLAVYVISTVASYIRWLATVDSMIQETGNDQTDTL